LVQLTETIGNMGLKNLYTLEQTRQLDIEKMHLNKINNEHAVLLEEYRQQNEELLIAKEKAEKREAIIQTQYQDLQATEEEIRAANEELVTTADALQQSNEELYIAKDKAEESKMQFKALFQNMNSSASFYEVIINKQGIPCDYRFLDVNEFYQKSLGLKASDLLGKTMLEIFPATEQLWLDTFKKVVLTGKPATLESYSKAVDMYLELIVYVPQKGKMAMIGSDITARKRIENELLIAKEKAEKSAEELKKAQEIAHVGSWYLDNVTNQVTWTEELYKMYDFDPTQPVPPFTEHRKLFKPESWERLSASLENARKNGVPYELELITIRKDGTNGWMWVHGEVVKNTDGKTIGLWGAAQDISERKQIEQELLQAKEKAEKNEAIIQTQYQDLQTTEEEIRANNEELVTTADALKQSYEELILAKEKAEESEMKYRLLATNTLDTIWTTDIEFNLTYVNNAIFYFLGYSPEEFLCINPSAFTPPEGMEKIQHAAEKLIDHYKNGEVKQVKIELQQIKKDGTVIDVEITTNLLFSDTNQLLGFQGRSVDITKQKQAERTLLSKNNELLASEEEIRAANEELVTTADALKQSNEELILANEKTEKINANISAIIENTTDSIWAINTNYELLYINNVFKNEFFISFGVQLETGMSLLNALPDTIKPIWKSRYDRVLSNEQFVFEDKIDIGNSFVYIQVAMNPIVADKKNIGASFFGSNVTERKQAEQELIKAKEKAEESDKLKTAFLENISHEVRTPMNAILGFSELLLKQNLTNESRNHFTDVMHKATYQLLSIVDNTITLAYLETKQLKINREDFNPAILLSKLFEKYTNKKQLIEKEHIQLFMHKPETSNSLINNDCIRINQIFKILLDNAFKFTEKGSIEFGYTFDENKINFFVKDTGIGIPPEKQEIIFESFAQADKTIRQLFGGLGVGLSIALGLVNLLDGKVTLNSQTNIGTEIIFSLPLRYAIK
jgi:PAS domain S-box-containing protein